jgi:DNA polymerase I-like protein with 3'-5' exonuclease and polymerase domains
LKVPAQEQFAWLNYFIQGTAAGIIKRAQVACERKLRAKYGDSVQMLLSIHDEIINECDEKLLRDRGALVELVSEIGSCMTQVAHISVPLEAEHKMAMVRWGEAEEVRT